MNEELRLEPLTSLNREWEELQNSLKDNSKDNSIFSTYSWQLSTALTCCEQEDLHQVLTLRNPTTQALSGIAPIIIKGDSAFFASDYNTTDFQDILSSPDKNKTVWKSVLSYLNQRNIESLDLTGINETSDSIKHLRELTENNNWELTKTNWDVDPIIKLPKSWDAYLMSLRKKDRHELKRKFRRLEKAGIINYYLVDNNSDTLDESLNDFMTLMAESKEEKAQFLTETRKNYFTTLIKIMAKNGKLRLFFMEIDGVRVSGTISFLHNRKLYLYNSGYNKSYSELSVGLLLKAHNIRYAIEEELEEFDFLRGNEPYKYHLGGIDRQIYRFHVSLN